MQLAEDRRTSEEAKNKQREMHDLLTFVQGQIHGEKLIWNECRGGKFVSLLHSRPSSNERSVEVGAFGRRRNGVLTVGGGQHEVM